MDADGNDTIELEEFYENMPEILPLLSLPGKSLESSIRQTFSDFDIDNSGSLDKLEIKLLIDITCDRMGIERTTKWQLDYIISLIDEDFDGMIDVEEFVTNYYIINRELVKNKQTIKKKKIDGDFFSGKDIMMTKKDNANQDKNELDFLEIFTGFCRNFQKIKKKKDFQKEATTLKKIEHESKNSLINTFGKESASQLLP